MDDQRLDDTKGFSLTEDMNVDSPVPRHLHQHGQDGPPTRWQENHGNLLVLFVGFVILIGAGILFYRQHRFVPVQFPTAIDSSWRSRSLV